MYDLYSKSAEKKGKNLMDTKSLAQYYSKWIEKYPLMSIEDPFDQDDWDGYRAFTAPVSEKLQVVGDDLLVTNKTRISKASEGGDAVNALLLKVNQIGTVSEAIEACLECQ